MVHLSDLRVRHQVVTGAHLQLQTSEGTEKYNYLREKANEDFLPPRLERVEVGVSYFRPVLTLAEGSL